MTEASEWSSLRTGSPSVIGGTGSVGIQLGSPPDGSATTGSRSGSGASGLRSPAASGPAGGGLAAGDGMMACEGITGFSVIVLSSVLRGG